MNKSKIQKFAVDGHKLLYKQIAQRAYQYGIEEGNVGKADATEVRGRILSPLEKSQRAALIAEINANGYPQTIERVTYIWFNRIVALRFMEVNNYLPSHIRVFSDASGSFKPEILNDVLHLEMEGLDKAQVAEYIENNNTEELYRYLLLTQCAELKAALPDVFGLAQRDKDYTELLFPNNMLHQDSFIGKVVSGIDEDDWGTAEDWQNNDGDHLVQIIGWLYQYYNDERKNEVINIYKGTVKKDDIPAATQLFTTDWVVRYMVDNSLGRYWIERHPESKLAEKLEFFVTPKNGEIKHVDEFVKPEDVKFLDPCMGSGHILVYAFDVLMEIYKESGYTERDAAAMIVQNNLFGLDIDDRASQLAYFAVMMKARSYDRRFLSRGIKPNVLAIKESNRMGAVVRDGLTTDAEMNAISWYLVDTFRDAKELGSIITVEPKDYDGYMAYLDNCDGEGQLTMEDADWLQNTRPMLKALARQAKVLAAKYLVVCTNPPYLNKIECRLKTFVTENYKDYSGDLFSVFTYRNLMFCKQDGYCGYMTPFVWMFIKTYEKLREFIIRNKSIATLVQMEYSAFEEATVPICSFVLKNGKATENGLYFKLSDFKGGMEVQKQKVLEALENKDCGYFYEADQSNFSKIPGSPVAYWVSSRAINCYVMMEKTGDHGDGRIGLITGDADRFLRLWHEVRLNRIGFGIQSNEESIQSGRRWFPAQKGGEFRRWYGNTVYVVNWENDGYEMRFDNFMGTRVRSHNYNGEYGFKKAITWTTISSSNFACRYSEDGFIYDTAGPFIHLNKDSEIAPILAFLNSIVADFYLKIMNPTINFPPGYIQSIPFSECIISKDIEDVSVECVALSKADWDSYETSWDFKAHPLIRWNRSLGDATSIGATIQYYYGKHVPASCPLELCYLLWKGECNKRFEKLKSNEEELNRIFIDIYGLQDELTPDVADKDITVHRVFDSKDDVPESMKGSSYVRTMRDEIVSLISYAVGCMFGRYSLDVEGLAYAGGEWDASKYKTIIPDSDNIIPICDDEYFDDDITGLFVEFVRKVYGEDTLEENLKFVADALGGKGTPREVIRSYFLNDFYADHLKTYQKRPIYWLFDSGKKNGFKALCYMHRYQRDLLARLRTDYVHEQQERYRTQLAQIGDAIDHASASERVKLTKQQKKFQEQAAELQKYEEKVHHLADQNIEIDLDDGVKHNYELFADVLAKIK